MTPEEDKRISAEYGVTPGEWRVWDDFPDQIDTGEGGVEIAHAVMPDGTRAAPEVLGETHANARLMAASKELVAELQRIVAAYHDIGEGDDASLCFYLAIQNTDALLERLKGGSNE